MIVNLEVCLCANELRPSTEKRKECGVVNLDSIVGNGNKWVAYHNHGKRPRSLGVASSRDVEESYRAISKVSVD